MTARKPLIFLGFCDLTPQMAVCYAVSDGTVEPPNRTTTAGGGKDMSKMPSNGEIIEKLARENERQRIEIEQLRQKVAELEAALAAKG